MLITLSRRGNELVHQHAKTPFGEVDLVFRAKTTGRPLLIVEVKTVNQESYFETRVTPSQTRRLRRACDWFYENEVARVGVDAHYPRLFFIFVHRFNFKLTFFEDVRD